MSIRFSRANQYIRRLTDLPASATAFSIGGFAKLAHSRTANNAAIALLAASGLTTGHQASLAGTNLRASSPTATTASTTVASVLADDSPNRAARLVAEKVYWQALYDSLYASTFVANQGTVVYIDLAAGVDGDGTAYTTPRNVIPTLVSGNTYLFKQGTTRTGQLSIAVNNVLLGTYYSANGNRCFDKSLLFTIDANGGNKCIDAPVTDVKCSGIRFTTTGTYASGGTFGFYSTPSGGGNNHTVEHCFFDNLSPATTHQGISGGIYIWGINAVVRCNRFRDTELDCVYISRSSGGSGPHGAQIYGNDIELPVGITTDGPDCIQVASTNGFEDIEIYDNWLVHASNMKQCIVVSGTSTSGDAVDILNNWCFGPDQTQPYPLNDPIRKGKSIYLECQNAVVEGNYIESGTWGIGLYGAGSRARGNLLIFDSPGVTIDIGIIIQGDDTDVSYNTFIVLSGTVTEAVEHYDVGVTGVTITDNLVEVRGGTLSIGIRYHPSSATEARNVVFGAVLPFTNQGGSGISPAATSSTVNPQLSGAFAPYDTSIALSAGPTIGTAFTDIRGNSSTTVPRRGALQYTDTSGHGQDWFAFVLVGDASGAGGLKLYHKPVGSGSVSVQSMTNTSFTPAEIRFGDNGTTPPSNGYSEFWFDGWLAHPKAWNVAISAAEAEQEMLYEAPVRATNLLSYNLTDSRPLANVVVPTQGAGTFTYPDQTPDISSDNPVLPLPGLRVSWAEMEVPFVAASIGASGVATRAAVGQPALSSTEAVSTVYASWVEIELPPPAAATQMIGVGSMAAVGLPVAQSSVALAASGVGGRSAVGQPFLGDGGFVSTSSVASVAAVGSPAASAVGQVNGFSGITAELIDSTAPFGVQTRRAVGSPTLTYVGLVSATGVASRVAIGAPNVSGGFQINLSSYGIISRSAVGRPAMTAEIPSGEVNLTGVDSMAVVGQPALDNPITTVTVVLDGRPTVRAVGQPGATSLNASGQVLIDITHAGGGPDADDDETVGPHKVPRGRRPKKDDEVKRAAQKAEEAAEQDAVATKPITAEAAPFPRPVEGGVLVTPAMLQQIKDDAMRAARVAVEARQMKEGRLVTAARGIAQQKAQQRLERLADLAIEAAEEAEYEPTEREQVKEIEIEDPVTGKPIRATIKSKVAA